MKSISQRLITAGIVAAGAVSMQTFLAGCEGRPSVFPNSDPSLNRTSTQFAADAARRFPYKADAPLGGEAQGRAQVDLTMGNLQILNYSDEDWNDVDVWVNKAYVCHVPRIEKGKERVKTIQFQMLYNQKGDYFWTNNGNTPMKEVELYRDGKMYRVPLQLAD